MLHSMTIRLIHVHQLGPSTYVIGSNTNLGSFGVTGVKRSFSLKMLYLVHDIAWPYILWSCINISISLKPSITFAGSTGNLGSVRGRSLKAGRVRRLWRQQCLVLSFFLLTMIASSSTCLIGWLPNLVRSMCGCMAAKLMGLKIHPGSYGVTGVKNVNHVKNMKTAQIQNLIMSSCRQ